MLPFVSVVPRMQEFIGYGHLPPNGVDMSLTPCLEDNRKLLRGMRYAFMIRIGVDREWLLRFRVDGSLHLKCPQQSSRQPPLSPFCEVDAWADPATGSVSIVIPVIVVRAPCVAICKLVETEISIRVVFLGVFVAFALTHVEGPGWRDDCSVLGYKVALVPVILQDPVWQTHRKAVRFVSKHR